MAGVRERRGLGGREWGEGGEGGGGEGREWKGRGWVEVIMGPLGRGDFQNPKIKK